MHSYIYYLPIFSAISERIYSPEAGLSGVVIVSNGII